MHETLSAAFGRAKLIQTSEEDPNILQNVRPKTKLKSCLCCQTPHRGLESLHLCCPDCTLGTKWCSSRTRQRIRGVTLQPDLSPLLLNVLPG